MTIHLIKLCVGVDDVAHLEQLQAQRLRQARDAGQPAKLRHVTRHTPRRAEELLDGGSIYWVIKGFVRVRQRIIGIEPVEDADGPRCALVRDPELVPTEAQARRPFQGWRYLRPEDAPPDATARDGARDMPPGMAAELRELGLL
jgi:hypothetical protein